MSEDTNTWWRDELMWRMKTKTGWKPETNEEEYRTSIDRAKTEVMNRWKWKWIPNVSDEPMKMKMNPEYVRWTDEDETRTWEWIKTQWKRKRIWQTLKVKCSYRVKIERQVMCEDAPIFKVSGGVNRERLIPLWQLATWMTLHHIPCVHTHRLVTPRPTMYICPCITFTTMHAPKQRRRTSHFMCTCPQVGQTTTNYVHMPMHHVY
jgi:hypothetical protein